MQTQSQVQAPQPAAAAPTNAISPVAPRYRFHWSHAVLAVGLVAASGAGTAVIIKVSRIDLSSSSAIMCGVLHFMLPVPNFTFG